MWEKLAIWFAMHAFKKYIEPKIEEKLAKARVKFAIEIIEQLRSEGKLK